MGCPEEQPIFERLDKVVKQYLKGKSNERMVC